MKELPTNPDLLAALADEPSALSERTIFVRHVVDSLPKAQREVFDAVFHERLSKREAARRLGIHRQRVDRELWSIADTVRERLSEFDRSDTAEAARVGPAPPCARL